MSRRIHREAADLPRLAPPDTLWMKVRGRLEAEIRQPAPVSARRRSGRLPCRYGAIRDGLSETARPTWGQIVTGWFRPLTVSPLRAAAFSSAIVLVLAVVTVLVLFRQPVVAPTTDMATAPAKGGRGGAAVTTSARLGQRRGRFARPIS